jgi:peptide/nickel transport system substrate-binding protein
MMKKKTAWWDKLVQPQYGGEMSFRTTKNIMNWDPYFAELLPQIYTAWMEKLTAEDWTFDPAEFDYKIVTPSQYMKGHLAENWEFTDPGTVAFHLRKGIHWQNIPPVNGREFTADDVVYHFHRLYGLGSGFTKPAPFHANVTMFKELISVTAADKYTVVFKWKTSNPEFITETLIAYYSPTAAIEAREAVEKWGDLNDWHRAVGTGPFILQDFVSGSSATMIKNPDYWGYDERYPQNRLPYVDKFRILVIPDDDSAMAAMRAGKLDIMDEVSLAQAQAMQKTNPEILQIPIPTGVTHTIDPRNDKAPFNDIRVRKALQMALDLSAIAGTCYGGSVDPYPSSLTSMYLKGWGLPYGEWSQDLKDEYAYNPAAARQLLADAGYPKGFKTNIVADATWDLDILPVIKSYFADIGIDMEIRILDGAAWNDFVRIGRKHDQLAYGAGTLGRTHVPMMQLHRFQTGDLISNSLMVSDPVFDAFYPKAMAATTVDEVKQVLRDANERVARQHYCVSLLTPKNFSLCQPWLNGYNGQFAATCGHMGSPQRLFFFPARFWIDRKLKQSMGYQ